MNKKREHNASKKHGASNLRDDAPHGFDVVIVPVLLKNVICPGILTPVFTR